MHECALDIIGGVFVLLSCLEKYICLMCGVRNLKFGTKLLGLRTILFIFCALLYAYYT